MPRNVRFTPTAICGLQVREGEGQEASRRVVGTPIVFGVRSKNLTPWSTYREVYEVLEPGCISDELLRESDVVLNINHSNKVTDILGRCSNGSGTLSLRKDAKKIESECDLPHTNAANDTLELIKRGDISGMSFAFEDDWEDSENGVSYERIEERNEKGKEVWLRHVKRITGLYDVSIVTNPAYPQTSVASREESDAIDKAITAQLERESASGEETPEQKAEREAREQAEREQKEAEEKAQREAEEKAQREAEEKAKAEEEARQLEEQAEREREMIVARERRRHQRFRLSNFEY